MGSVGLDVSVILHVKRPLHILRHAINTSKTHATTTTNELELQTFWADARNIHNSRPSNRVSNVNDQRNERFNQAQIKTAKVYENPFLVEIYTLMAERFAAQKIT